MRLIGPRCWSWRKSRRYRRTRAGAMSSWRVKQILAARRHCCASPPREESAAVKLSRVIAKALGIKIFPNHFQSKENHESESLRKSAKSKVNAAGIMILWLQSAIGSVVIGDQDQGDRLRDRALPTCLAT